MNNSEFQKELISLMVHDPEYASRGISELQEQDFTDPECIVIFRAMRKLSDSKSPIDLITVCSEFPPSELLTSISKWLSLDPIMQKSSWSYYVQKLREDRKKREWESGVEQIQNISDVDSALSETEMLVDRVRSIGSSPSNRVSTERFANAVIHSADSDNRIQTGFPSLDKLISGGFGIPSLNVIAGRPGMGKSSLALRLSVNLLEQGKTVAFFSLESSEGEIFTRIGCQCLRCSVYALRNNSNYIDPFNNLCEKVGKEWNFYHIEESGLTASEIISQCYSIRNEGNGLHAVFIDHVGLVRSASNNRYQNRQQELSEIVKQFQGACKALNTSFVLCSQINRESDKRINHIPMLSDLRESGEIEQAADLVIMPFRPDYYNRMEEADGGQGEPETEEAMFLVTKNRGGACRSIPVQWIGKHFLYTEGGIS